MVGEFLSLVKEILKLNYLASIRAGRRKGANRC